MSRFLLAQESTFDINGLPQVGATLDFHNVGLLTGKDTFFDEDLQAGNENPNPVVADANGNFGNIWLDGDYDVTLKNSAGATIWGPETIRNLVETSSPNAKLNPLTTSIMVNDTNFSVADVGVSVPVTKEFSTDAGGTGTYDIVLTSSVSTNIADKLVGVAEPLIAFILRKSGKLLASQWGISPGRTAAQNDAAWLVVVAHMATNKGRFVLDVVGDVLHDTSWETSTSNTAFEWIEGAELKANSVMGGQFRVGDGVNRKEDIQFISPRLNGDGKASFGFDDLGVRISGIRNGYFRNHLEQHIIQRPTTVDFTEALIVDSCQGFDAKSFIKSVATSSSRCTDAVLTNNIMFRPTEWFAELDTCQRYKCKNNIVASQTTSFLGGFNITSSDTNASATPTTEHDIEDVYVESNANMAANFTGTHDGANDAAVLTDTGASFGATDIIKFRKIKNLTDGSETIITANSGTTITGVLSGGTDNDWDIGDSYEVVPMVAIQISNTSTNKTVGGIGLRNIVTQPANVVAIADLQTPAVANTIRQTEINGLDAKSGFAKLINIESGVIWTRIEDKNYESGAHTFITDAGTSTSINGILQSGLGAFTKPLGTSLAVGDIFKNTTNNSTFTKDKDGNIVHLGFDTIFFSATRDIPSVPAGGTIIPFSETVTGTTLGDFASTSFATDVGSLQITEDCRTNLVVVKISNPTGSAIDPASTTMRIVVYIH